MHSTAQNGTSDRPRCNHFRRSRPPWVPPVFPAANPRSLASPRRAQIGFVLPGLLVGAIHHNFFLTKYLLFVSLGSKLGSFGMIGPGSQPGFPRLGLFRVFRRSVPSPGRAKLGSFGTVRPNGNFVGDSPRPTYRTPPRCPASGNWLCLYDTRASRPQDPAPSGGNWLCFSKAPCRCN
jgi:hypothetical protein